MREDEIPTRAELISQAVNGDMVRIITNHPPDDLVLAKRLEITRRALAVSTALAAGATLIVGFTLTAQAFTIFTVATTALALIGTVTWGATIVYAHRSRVALLRKYGVAPNRDGVFELLREGEPHTDLAATREMLREYAGAAPDRS